MSGRGHDVLRHGGGLLIHEFPGYLPNAALLLVLARPVQYPILCSTGGHNSPKWYKPESETGRAIIVEVGSRTLRFSMV